MLTRVAFAAGSIGVGVGVAGLLTVRPAERLATAESSAVLVSAGGAPQSGELSGIAAWLEAINRHNEPPAGLNVDISIDSLSNLVEIDRDGEYPNGRIGMAMNTTSCNVGDVDVPWFAPMEADHPFIGQNLYRLKDGRFEQIGLAWLKHAFFAADAFGCGQCQFDLFDDMLNVGCSDTYSYANNGERAYLGPRYEVNPLTAEWEPCGSHFDIGNGSQPDCERSHGGSGHGPVDHRLRVYDQELLDPEALFYYEGFYIVRGDTNVYNNVAWKLATPIFSGGDWDFVDNTTGIYSPAVFGWGQYHYFASNPEAGDAIVSMRTIDLGGGQLRYIYVVTNYNMPQGIQSFTVPFASGTQISNVGFHAPIEDEEPFSTDPWAVQVGADSVTWSTETHAQNPAANSIRFGTSYTFWFDANAAPSPTTATLNLYEPGDVSVITSSTVGPGGAVSGGLVLEVDPLVRGEQSEIRIAGAEPGQRVYVLYSIKAMGRSYIPQADDYLDIKTPIDVAASATANASGEAVVRIRVPASAPPTEAFIQAATLGTTPVKSNVHVRTIN